MSPVRYLDADQPASNMLTPTCMCLLDLNLLLHPHFPEVVDTSLPHLRHLLWVEWFACETIPMISRIPPA